MMKQENKYFSRISTEMLSISNKDYNSSNK